MAHKIRVGVEEKYKPPLTDRVMKSQRCALMVLFIIIVIMILILASLSNFPSGESTTPQSNPPPSSNIRYVEFEVNYSGQWSGSIMVGTEYSSFDSSGYQRIGVNLTIGTYYSFSAQKMENGYDKLDLRLYSDGNQVKYAFTNTEYGIASVYWTVE